MTRYKITFEDGGETSVCLDYVPKVGDHFGGGLLAPKIIASVEVVS